MAISDRMKRMHNCVGITLKNEGFKGELYNCYENEPEEFNDVDDFFNIVNSFLDALEYPAQKIKYRSFKKTLPTLKLVDIDPKEKLFDTEKLLDLCKRKAYIIMVTGRDNATWQGMIYSKSEDKEYSFNSEVELVRILNK
ncbi:hypothetical protein SAMN04487830_11336 [Pseudobutyrivibrio sp. OR37]|uniref:hypothetical protein n=1 Tax=Pseudobutyrivibrio sp. OR37 TaxID=1798186 RepID=UPI0008EF8B58|nr:hypothetical protein [Pseudobutyrivibrio sp. OR37]SFH93138.1 hypothetical protein SAMN04487830_11336 [Pseudobutyrivibrio sp. OR37]